MFGGSGADPGFLLGGGASPRNDVTDGEVKKFEKRVRIYEDESFIWGGGGGVRTPCTVPLDPPLRLSAKQKIVRGREPSKINLDIFVFSFAGLQCVSQNF